MPADGTTNSTSGLTGLTLSARIDGAPELEVFLQHGLSIGRNPSNTICVNDPAIERIHAMVQRLPDGSHLLECTEPHLRIQLADGKPVHSVDLTPGITFKVGKATIRCLKRSTRPTVVVSDNPWDVQCPRCKENIADLNHTAGHCPECKLAIQYFQSHAGEVPSDSSMPTIRPAVNFQGWLPREIGPYMIRAFVAQGGMGIVLRGLHKEMDVPAAVKLLKFTSDEDPTWKQRFVAEIDTLKGLKHPNVVRLQASGQDQKLMWLAMDWIDGQALSQVCVKYRAAGNNVPIDEIKAMMLQVVAGLEYLHGRQIVHRDLKPSNVLIAQDGLVKMVDFGIARGGGGGQHAIQTQLTQTGMVAGTESYMSPEQAEGQHVSPASDIYSLGVMWYELVTGRRPLGAFMAPNLIRKDCPGAWSSAIAQCLQVNPQVRPLLAQITSALQSTSAGPPPIPGGQRAATMVPPIQPRPTVGASPGPTGPPSATGPGIDATRPTGATAGAAGAAGAAVKATGAAVGSFLKQHPPSDWLKKMGPVGTWIRTHRGPSIAIACVVGLVFLMVLVRSCSSSGNSTENTNANNHTAANNTNTPGDNHTNAPAPNKQPPSDPLMLLPPDQEYAAAYQKGRLVRGPDDPKGPEVINEMTDSANKGNTNAMMYLVNLYGTPNVQYPNLYDRSKAVLWARKAESAGDPRGTNAREQLNDW